MPPTEPAEGAALVSASKSSRRDPQWLFVLAALLLAARIVAIVMESRRPIEPMAEAGVELVNWRSPQQGQSEAKRSGKPVLFDFTADWCPPCQQMKAELFADASAARTLEELVVPVRVLDRRRENGRNPPEVDSLQRAYRITAFPTLIVAWPEREGFETSTGYRGVPATLEWLSRSVAKVRTGTATR